MYTVSVKMCDLDLTAVARARIRARSIIKLKCHFAKVARGVIFFGDFLKSDITDSAGRERQLLGSGASCPSVKDIGRFRELPERETKRKIRRKRKRERESSQTIFLSASVSQHELAHRFDLANSRNKVPARLRCGKTDGALLSYIC